MVIDGVVNDAASVSGGMELMMKIKRDDIKYFIDRDWEYSQKEVMRSCLITMLLVCIPIATVGIYSVITSITMLPVVVALSIWNILLLKDPINQNQYNLFSGIFSLFFSLSCLVAAYKHSASLGQQISTSIVFFILGLYFVGITVNSIITIHLIREGYYKHPRKYINTKFIVSIIAIIGIIFGRRLFIALDRNVADNLFTIILVTAAFVFAAGTSCFLRFYLAVKIKE